MIIGINGYIGSGKDTVTKMIQYLDLCNKKEVCYPYDHFIDDLENNVNIEFSFGNRIYFQNVKWADKLKDCVCIILGCTREDLENQEFKNKTLGEEWTVYSNMHSHRIFDSYDGAYYNAKWVYDNPNAIIKSFQLTPRKILQLLGTECGRNIVHPNIWINATLRNYNEDSKWIISDTRMSNEFDKIKELGGINIRVDRFKLEQLNENDLKISTFDDTFSVVYSNKNHNLAIELFKKDYRNSEVYRNLHISETALDYNKFDAYIITNGNLHDLFKEVMILWENKIKKIMK